MGPIGCTLQLTRSQKRESNPMLRIYPHIIRLLQLLKPVFDKIALHDSDLARQGRRAGSSIALNTLKAAG